MNRPAALSSTRLGGLRSSGVTKVTNGPYRSTTQTDRSA